MELETKDNQSLEYFHISLKEQVKLVYIFMVLQ